MSQELVAMENGTELFVPSNNGYPAWSVFSKTGNGIDRVAMTFNGKQIYINRNIHNHDEGINLVIIDAATLEVVNAQAYNTYYSPEEDRALYTQLVKTWNTPNQITLMAVRGDGQNSMAQDTKDLISAYGSGEIQNLGFRHPWAFMGSNAGLFGAAEMRQGENGYAWV